MVLSLQKRTPRRRNPLHKMKIWMMRLAWRMMKRRKRRRRRNQTKRERRIRKRKKPRKHPRKKGKRQKKPRRKLKSTQNRWRRKKKNLSSHQPVCIRWLVHNSLPTLSWGQVGQEFLNSACRSRVL
jgi:hypothetical protein